MCCDNYYFDYQYITYAASSCFFIGKNVLAYYDDHFARIRHINCFFYIPEANSRSRCSVCTTYRENVLCSALNRLLKQSDENSVTVTKSHVNFHCLTMPEKMGHLQNLSRLVRCKEKQIQGLCNRLSKLQC